MTKGPMMTWTKGDTNKDEEGKYTTPSRSVTELDYVDEIKEKNNTEYE